MLLSSSLALTKWKIYNRKRFEIVNLLSTDSSAFKQLLTSDEQNYREFIARHLAVPASLWDNTDSVRNICNRHVCLCPVVRHLSRRKEEQSQKQWWQKLQRKVSLVHSLVAQSHFCVFAQKKEKRRQRKEAQIILATQSSGKAEEIKGKMGHSSLG